MITPGRVKSFNLPALGVDHLQPPADMHGSGGGHKTLLDHAKLGRAAADVDIEDALALVVRHPGGARAVCRQQRFHVMTGGGADELAALLGEDFGNALGVLAPQRLAGQDHGAGVDLVGMKSRAGIGVVDDLAEAGIVDPLFALVGREGDR